MNCWDKAYYLTIDRLKERQQSVEQECINNHIEVVKYIGVDKNHINKTFLRGLLQKKMITPKVYYLYTTTHLNRLGSLACLLTHVSLWIKLKSEVGEAFLIFEDDVKILPEFKIKLNRYYTHVPSDWDIIWGGYNHLWGKGINEYIVKPYRNTRYGYNTQQHCYLIKKASIDKMINILLPKNNVYSKDGNLRENFHKFNAYFIIDKLAIQNINRFNISERAGNQMIQTKLSNIID